MNKRAASLLCSAVIVLTACTSDKAPEMTAEIKPAPPFQELNMNVEGRNNIYLIVKNLESSYWQVIIKGARDAGDLYDTNIYYSGSYIETDWEGQARLMQEAVDAGADAIILAPDDSVMLSEKIGEVYDAGIPTILIDTTANTEKYDICYMTDNLMAGRIAAAEMINRLEDLGHTNEDHLQIGIEIGAVTSQTISERLAGFIMYWSDNSPENWELVTDIKCNEGIAEKSAVVAQELLDEYPNIRGLFGTNNSSTVGLATAVKDNGRTDIAIVGFDYSDEIAELITSDEYSAATVLQQQYLMTKLGVEAANILIDGGTLERKFVDTGVIAVNHDNINDKEVQEVLDNN